MTKTPIRSLLSGGIAALVLLSTAPVLAQSTQPLARFAVETSDIDLTSTAGVEQLRKRVASTIRWACGPVANWTPAEVKALNECRADAEAAVEPMLRKALARGNARLAAN